MQAAVQVRQMKAVIVNDRKINLNSIDELKLHVLEIKKEREIKRKKTDLSTMVHITTCIGGKMRKEGLITQKEIDNLIYFDWEWIYN